MSATKIYRIPDVNFFIYSPPLLFVPSQPHRDSYWDKNNHKHDDCHCSRVTCLASVTHSHDIDAQSLCLVSWSPAGQRHNDIKHGKRADDVGYHIDADWRNKQRESYVSKTLDSWCPINFSRIIEVLGDVLQTCKVYYHCHTGILPNIDKDKDNHAARITTHPIPKPLRMPQLVKNIEQHPSPWLQKQIPDIPHNKWTDNCRHINTCCCDRLPLHFTIHEQCVEQTNNIKQRCAP